MTRNPHWRATHRFSPTKKRKGDHVLPSAYSQWLAEQEAAEPVRGLRIATNA